MTSIGVEAYQREKEFIYKVIDGDDTIKKVQFRHYNNWSLKILDNTKKKENKIKTYSTQHKKCHFLSNNDQ